jgi:hypothetical protein
MSRQTTIQAACLTLVNCQPQRLARLGKAVASVLIRLAGVSLVAAPVDRSCPILVEGDPKTLSGAFATFCAVVKPQSERLSRTRPWGLAEVISKATWYRRKRRSASEQGRKIFSGKQGAPHFLCGEGDRDVDRFVTHRCVGASIGRNTPLLLERGPNDFEVDSEFCLLAGPNSQLRIGISIHPAGVEPFGD